MLGCTISRVQLGSLANELVDGCRLLPVDQQCAYVLLKPLAEVVAERLVIPACACLLVFELCRILLHRPFLLLT